MKPDSSLAIRKRTTHFSDEERENLRLLVEKYKDEVENLSTKASAIISKTKAWEKIATEYNNDNPEKNEPRWNYKGCGSG